MVNFNVLNLQLQTAGDSLRVQSTTPLDLQTTLNVQLVGGPCDQWDEKLKPVFSFVNQQINLQLTGTYARNCAEKSWVLHPYPLAQTEYDGALFRKLWHELGGQFDGEVKSGSLTAEATSLMDFSSVSLADALRDMNKYSNNAMARLVFLTLDRQAHQLPANALRAGLLVEDLLAAQGIDVHGLQLENGSGLSRTEQITATQMGTMLRRAFASPVMPELLSSLPILGVDGTMKKRALNLPVAGHAHIKSGSLEGVRAMAGYVLAATGKRYVVVCFVNHKNASASTELQDQLLEWIYTKG